MAVDALRNAAGTFTRLVGFMGKWKRAYIFGMAIASLYSFLYSLTIAWALRKTYLVVAGAAGSSQILTTAIFIGSIAAVYLINGVGRYLVSNAVIYTTAAIRLKLFDHFCRFSPGKLENLHSGEFLSRATNDINSAEAAYGQNIRLPAVVSFSGICSGVVIFGLNFKMGILAFGISVLTLIPNLFLLKPIKTLSNEIQKKSAGITASISDILKGHLELKLNNAYEWQKSRLERLSYELVGRNIKRGLYQAVLTTINVLSSGGGFLVILAAGSWLVTRGELQLPDLLFIAQMRIGVQVFILAIGSMLIQLQSSLAGAERVFELLDFETEQT